MIKHKSIFFFFEAKSHTIVSYVPVGKSDFLWKVAKAGVFPRDIISLLRESGRFFDRGFALDAFITGIVDALTHIKARVAEVIHFLTTHVSPKLFDLDSLFRWLPSFVCIESNEWRFESADKRPLSGYKPWTWEMWKDSLNWIQLVI